MTHSLWKELVSFNIQWLSFKKDSHGRRSHPATAAFAYRLSALASVRAGADGEQPAPRVRAKHPDGSLLAGRLTRYRMLRPYLRRSPAL